MKGHGFRFARGEKHVGPGWTRFTGIKEDLIIGLLQPNPKGW